MEFLMDMAKCCMVMERILKEHMKMDSHLEVMEFIYMLMVHIKEENI